MTGDQTPPENESGLLINELSMAFNKSYGIAIGQLTVDNLALNKQVEQLQNRLAAIEVATASLKEENSKLMSQHIGFRDIINSLEAENEALIKAGPTLEQIADRGRAIIQQGQEKEEAAPDEGGLPID